MAKGVCPHEGAKLGKQDVEGVERVISAGGGSRTHKVVTPEDFKSSASAYSATPAGASLKKLGGDDRIRTDE